MLARIMNPINHQFATKVVTVKPLHHVKHIRINLNKTEKLLMNTTQFISKAPTTNPHISKPIQNMPIRTFSTYVKAKLQTIRNSPDGKAKIKLLAQKAKEMLAKLKANGDTLPDGRPYRKADFGFFFLFFLLWWIICL